MTRTKRSEPLFFRLTFNMNGTAAEVRAPLCEGAPDTARRTRSSPSFFSNSNGLALPIGADTGSGLSRLRSAKADGNQHHCKRVHDRTPT